MNISLYSDINYLNKNGIFIPKNKSINKVDNKDQLSKSSNISATSSSSSSSSSFTLPLKLLGSVRNYEVRGHPWNMIAVCINEKKPEEILMADQRGQVFLFLTNENIYKLVRLASGHISALSFIPTKPGQMVVAYDNGCIQVIDINHKNTLNNVRASNPELSIVKIISCHPKKQILLLASSNKEISVWNLETKKCTYTLQCRDNIVDLRFEANGSLIALTLQHTGCLYYQFKDFKLILEAKLIESERETNWTSYCTVNTSDAKKTIRTILGAENGNLYIWTSTNVMSNTSTKDKVKQANLIGVVELPAQISMAVSIVKVDEEAGSFRLALMCKEGDVLILKVDNSGIATVGSWSIVCILPSMQLHGLHNAEISPFYVNDEGLDKESRPGSGKMMTCNGKVLAIVGLDGVTRVFDIKTKLSKVMLKTLHARAANPIVGPAMKVVTKKEKKKIKMKKQAKRLLPSAAIKEVDELLDDDVVNDDDDDDDDDYEEVDDRSSTYNTSDRARRSKDDVQVSGNLAKLIDRLDKVEAALAPSRPFELSNLTPSEKALNEKKLRAFVMTRGSFPDSYRSLIWQFFLQLPENELAFAKYKSRETHTAFRRLDMIYPISSETHFNLLQNACSRLAHWSQVLARAPYLPQLVFPFTFIFPDNELHIFESIMTILMWWGYGWHVSYPSSPVQVIEALDTILKKQDRTLHNHLISLGINPGDIAWQLMSTMFTEILCKSDWYHMMDFLIAHIQVPSYILLAPVAVMVSVRVSVLSSISDSHVMQYFSNQQGIDVPNVIRLMNNMLTEIPTKVFACLNCQDLNINEDLDNEDFDDDELKEKLAEKREQAVSHGKALFPLPMGSYPSYDAYPHFIVEYESKKQEKESLVANEKARKQAILNSINDSMAKVEINHEQWLARQHAAVSAEEKFIQEEMEKEREKLTTLQKLDAEIAKRRVYALATIEKTAQAEMEEMDRIAASNRELMQKVSQFNVEKLEIAMTSNKNRSLAEGAEAAAHDRLVKLRMRRVREDWNQNIARLLRSKQEEIEHGDIEIEDRWSNEDEIQRQLRAKRIDQVKNFADEQRNKRVTEDINSRITLLNADREVQVMEIDHQRNMRISREKFLTEKEEKTFKLLSKQIESYLTLGCTDGMQHTIDSLKTVELSEASVQFILSTFIETVKNVREEANRLIEAERIHAKQAELAEEQAYRAQLQKEWTDALSSQLHDVLKAEGELQEQMVLLKRAAMREEAEEACIANASSATASISKIGQNDDSAGGLAAVFTEISKEGDKLLKRQRERFLEIQKALESLQMETATNRSHRASTENSKVNRSSNTNNNRSNLNDTLNSTLESLSKSHNLNETSGSDVSNSINQMLIPLNDAVRKASQLLLNKPRTRDSSGSEGSIDMDKLLNKKRGVDSELEQVQDSTIWAFDTSSGSDSEK